ncbi:hypothetical protein ACQ86E_19190 [Bradyrhizobium betae]|uniref:hypothetical protein n=1 Tax=Bradyrhizobium betae TaxID=244734 RepID=UPI003D67951C
MVLAPDFLDRIAERIEKILVGRDDRSVGVELDHGLRAADRIDLGLRVATGLAAKHVVVSRRSMDIETPGRQAVANRGCVSKAVGWDN